MAFWGILSALLSACSWAFGTITFERIGKVVPFVGITFLKGVFSIVLMILLLVVTGGLYPIGWGEFSFLALGGIVGITIGDSLFFKSLQDLGAKTQVIFFLLGQILTMILSLLFLGELLSVEQYIGAFILLTGVIVTTWGTQTNHPNKIRGIIFGLASMTCFSVSAIMVKAAISDVPVITATFYRMVFGTIFTLGYGVASKNFSSWIRPLKDKKLLGLFVFNVIVITYGGFLLSMAAIKYISVSLASVLGATEPIFVLLLAFLLMREKVTKREVIGTIVTLVGLFLIINSERL